MKLPWDNPAKPEKSEGGYVRQRSADPYHTNRWTRLSRAYRANHPLCEMCKAKGIIKPATCVDHIEPWPICADRFYDLKNLQSLCDECNHLKGQRDKKRIEQWRLTHGQK